MSAFIADLDCIMPTAVQFRHWKLNLAARRCYALRDAAEHCGDLGRSADYHELGDFYLYRSFALSEEWE